MELFLAINKDEDVAFMISVSWQNEKKNLTFYVVQHLGSRPM